MQIKCIPAFTLVALTFVAEGALAVDGVIEINQTRAQAGGVTPTDTPGFPVTIGVQGSYRLTGDLQVPDANTTAIDVRSSDVTIDLNGFGIYGPTVCTQQSDSSVTCTPTGVGDGVRALGSGPGSFENVTVKNGTIRGVGRFGTVMGGNQGRVEYVRAQSNGTSGLTVNSLTLTRGGSVIFSTSINNGTDGIFVGSDGLARGNVAVGNGRNGIRANSRSVVLDNTMTQNATTGLNVSTGSGYGNNVISENNGGNANPQVSGTGVEIGGNVCGFNTVCP
jgi:hypothetical protein